MSDFSGGDIAAAVDIASTTTAPDASPASDPSPTDSTVASPTETPAGEATTTGSTTPTEPHAGEPPKERWADILDNTRKKSRAEVEAEFDAQYGWAKQVNRDQLTQFSDLAQRMTSDPVGFVTQFVGELQADPQYAAQMRSQAARILGTRTPTPQNVEPQPDVEIVDAHGNVTGRTYSDKALAARDAWLRQQIVESFQQEIAPLKQDRESRLMQEQQAAQQREANAKADAVLNEAKGWHGFEENLSAIYAAMQQRPEWNLHQAYVHVLNTSILPNLQASAKKSVVADLNRKPAASTVSPGSGTAAVTVPDSEMSWEDLFAEKSRQFGLR